MPIYEYQCTSCGQEFTAIRRITDETLPECPACKSGQVTKKISLSAFHLKGSGWYKTDYAKSGAGGNGKPAKKPSDSGESRGSESKGSESKGSDTSAAGDSSASTPAAKPASSDKPAA